MDEYISSIGDKFILITVNGLTRVRISPANNLKSKEVTIPIVELRKMINNQLMED